MDLIELGNTSFPPDFQQEPSIETVAKLANIMLENECSKHILKVQNMVVTLRHGHVSFDLLAQVQGGVNDGLNILYPMTITDMDGLKLWATQMTCLGAKPWELGYGQPLSFVEGWDVLKAELKDQLIVSLATHSVCIYFRASYILYDATCSECVKTSPHFWSITDLEMWLNQKEWLEFPAEVGVKYFCKKCTRKILKF